VAENCFFGFKIYFSRSSTGLRPVIAPGNEVEELFSTAWLKIAFFEF